VRARKIIALAALLLASTTLSFVAAEAVARLVSPFPEKHEKHWMLSSPTFRADSHGAVRYVPNQTIRSVMLEDEDIVYDVRFRTNDLGFIDHEDYLAPAERDASGPRYAFVGDSFTAGFHGGTPWVPALRDEARKIKPGLEIYNFGVSGTGFEHFVRLLESAGAEVDFSEIVILAISYDFWRPYWTPLATDDALRFCGTDEPRAYCLAAVRPVARIFNEALDQSEVKALVAGLAEAPVSESRKPRDRLLEHSRLAALLFGQYRRLKLRLSRRKSLDRLADLRDRFPDKKIRFIHLPSMSELARGSYDLPLEGHIAELGIEYFPAMTACSWPEGMFFPSDGHPNAVGYEAIARCVSSHLGLAP
jgi:hypothetical protein